MATEPKQPPKLRPILFTAPMVRALLAGKKTQTRRIMKPQPPEGDPPTAVEWFRPALSDRHGNQYPGAEIFGAYGDNWHLKCPYGEPGHRLYVRETFAIYEDEIARGPGNEVVLFEADDSAYWHMPNHYPLEADFNPLKNQLDFKPKWKPSIHMPKWASRIILEVTDVGVERVQEITEEDAIAEGVQLTDGKAGSFQSYKQAYAWLWHEINGPESWGSNPFVWVVSFKRIV